MRYLLLRLAVMLSVLLVSQTASAAIDQSGVLDTVADRFLAESATWGAKITAYATWLFWTLATISMVWTFGMLALRKADIGDFFAELVRFTIFTGFFWWLLQHGPSFAMDIINSLRTVGAEAGNVTRTLTPSAPLDIAFDIIKKAAKGYSVLHPIDNLAIFFTTLAILACMAVVAANVLLALVTAWVVAYAGIFVLGFGGSRWTSDIAINYFRGVAGIALKLMTMTLLIGVAVAIMDGFYRDLQEGAPMRELLVIFVVSLVLLVLIHTIPNIIAGLIPGGGAPAAAGSSFSAGAIAGAAMGAASMAAGAAGMAGAAVMNGAASAAGGASAIKAAFEKAAGSMSGGGGDMPSFDFGGGGSSGSGSGGGGDAGTGSTPFAQAAGFGGGSSSGGGSTSTGSSSGGSKGGDKGSGSTPSTGGLLAATAANLAQGIGDVAKAKAASIREAAAERIADTTGGKIAAAIKAQGSGAAENIDVPDQKPAPSFGDNSLAGDTSADPESEVAAFANRDSGNKEA